eukprot:1111783-Amphidinium_carterae.2
MCVYIEFLSAVIPSADPHSPHSPHRSMGRQTVVLWQLRLLRAPHYSRRPASGLLSHTPSSIPDAVEGLFL